MEMQAHKKILKGKGSVKVLVSQLPDDPTTWFALALEMDIWGFGTTQVEAMNDLRTLMETQIDFALSRNEPELLDHPADRKWFMMYESLIPQSLKSVH